MLTPPRVSVLSLGCARNDVDSEELAARLEAGGFTLVEEPGDADVAVVNTCGFVASAKKDSIDAILDLAAGASRPVVAVGCLAERYGAELAAELPEAAAVLGFDSYPQIAERLQEVLDGRIPEPHVPRDRRRLLPIAPSARVEAVRAAVGRTPAPMPAPAVAPEAARPGPASGPRTWRRRLGHGPVAPLKLASGCDRRCSFCAIPAFRGAFVSRPAEEVLADASWLAGTGARELFLVSENTTSYGKDLGDLRLLERLLPRLASVPGVCRVRVSYLQPAEVRPTLLDAMTSIRGVAPYFDLSFQHASAPVLRRMRRFGSRERFLELVADIRQRCPDAGIRSNVIVGFPGETEADLAELEAFLVEARLDAVGVFGYSDEDGTEAARLDGHLDEEEIDARTTYLAGLVDELVAQRAEDRLGEVVEVLVERVQPTATGWRAEGLAAHQGPEVDGTTSVEGGGPRPAVGDLVRAVVVGSSGADLEAALAGDESA